MAGAFPVMNLWVFPYTSKAMLASFFIHLFFLGGVGGRKLTEQMGKSILSPVWTAQENVTQVT